MRMVLVGLLISWIATPIAAAEPACPAGNVLSGRAATASGVSRAKAATDGVAPNEGDTWNTSLTAVMAGRAASLTWDLGEPTTLDAFLLQGDNNDTYTISVSDDGKTFTPLWVVPQTPQPGMRTRLHQGANAQARYVRVYQASGDNAYSLGEVQAFCEKPAVWPPALKRASGKATGKKDARKSVMAQSKMTYGLFALMLFIGLALTRREGVTEGLRKASGAWVFLALAVTIFLDRNGYSMPSYAAVAHVFVGGFVAWRLPQKDVDPRRLGMPIAVIGGVAALLFATWRTRSEILPRVSEATPHSIKANLFWVALAIVAICLIFLVIRMLSGQALGRLGRYTALLSVVIAGGLTWVNFGTFHGSRAVHYWDSFHYYMGSKYFKETRYHLLYQCAAIGEVDDGLAEEFKSRKIRDLRNNQLLPAAPQLSRDEECRANFTPERWAAFRQDLRLFRAKMGSAWWKKMFKDHGYNASPVWNMMGNAFANHAWLDHIPPPEFTNSPANLRTRSAAEKAKILANFKDVQVPAFEDRIQTLALIDGALYVGIFILIGWAFGLEVCALALAILAIGYPWAYFWTGGGYGRVPWLFMATAGVCCMKRGLPLLGGFAITWTTLLRAFPGALAAGIVLKVGWNLLRHRSVTRVHRRIIIGAVLGLAILIPASLPSSDGIGAYQEFLGNSMKHKQTPLTNHMGLPMLVAWGPKLIARHTKNSKLEDPFKIWKETRLKTLKDRKILHYALLLAFLGLIMFCAWRMEDWEATAISAIMIIGIFDLTCYYYNFIILLAPVAMRRARYVFALLLMALVSQLVQLKVGYYDEQYLWETTLVLGVLLYMIGDIAWRQRAAPERDFPDKPVFRPFHRLFKKIVPGTPPA